MPSREIESSRVRWRLAVGVLLAAGACLWASCAPTMAPPPVVTPAFPDFMFPAVPPNVGTREAVDHHQRGWRYLQAKDFRNAEREFAAALKRAQGFYPAETALGFVHLAQRGFRDALQHFTRGLAADATYVPALVGQGEALIGLNRPAEAAASFRAAVTGDPALTHIRQRLEVLELRALQENLAAAREAAEQGRYDEARAAYARAIAGSPESPFLYRDLAVVEQKQGRIGEALAHLRTAVSLDPSDARSWGQLGETLETAGDDDGAAEAFAKAAAIEPGGHLAERAEAARARAMLARLPAEYRALPATPLLTRAGLAALVGVRFDSILRATPERPAAVVTDVRDHWAALWILLVTRAGVMDLFPNHTFQPAAPVRRGDLAQALTRLLTLVAAGRPRMPRPWEQAHPAIEDLPPEHLSYRSAATAVSTGLMALTAEGLFQPVKVVSGAEAIEALERLQVLERAWSRVVPGEERRP